MASSSASTSTSTSYTYTPKWGYDVFLSFRGEDTREGFTNYLYDALCRYGINAFIDDQLPKGEGISRELEEKIEESRMSIVVFSENYASSGWCLDELVKILECKNTMNHQVRPIFYRINPSEVRHQTGKTGEYLAKHGDRYKDKLDKVEKWRQALKELANLAGWHFTHGVESKFIQRVVEEVSSKLNRPALTVAAYPVGLDDTMERISSVLGIGSDDVRMIGIYGIGGIGKSTIAKAIYNQYADSFEGSSFLANVKETSRQYGLVHVQETLLYEILGDALMKVGNADRGISIISWRLCAKKVLIVIDDVDHLDQLRKLAGDKAWFGAGSRIIITTRDKHLLEAHGVEHFHEVKELNYIDSYRLFCWNAFKKPNPPKEFEELSSSVLSYAKGLPLALIVLGSFLCSRSVKEWESAIARLKSIPNKEYNEILKISYDGLDDLEQAIFLDIACFYSGEDKDYVMKIFDACNFFPDIGLRVLIDRSLVSVHNNKLSMHDLLQEMGREIVRKEAPNNPGERSRLWFADDVVDVLTENLGTNKVEAINLVLPESEGLYLNAKAFKRMRRLRVLIIRNANISGDFDYLSNNLRWIDWEGYPSPSLPSNFHPKKLVGLYMPSSHLKDLGEGYKIFKNLQHMNLERSQYLTEIPDFSTLPYLESLILFRCTSLVELHESIGQLDRLVTLNLEYCFNLKRLPSSLKLKSLRSLLLTLCKSLEEFPETLENMESLKELRLSKTALKELPLSIENLAGLEILCVSGCKKLSGIRSGIYRLRNLKHLLLRNCFQLSKHLQQQEDKRQQLVEFGIDLPLSDAAYASLAFSQYSSAQQETESLLSSTMSSDETERSKVRFPMLQFLDLRNCSLSEACFLEHLDCISTLEEIELSRNNFVKLPEWISKFANLRKLEINFCRQLQEIAKLPQSVETISATGCESLEKFAQFSSMTESHSEDLPCLKLVNFTNCHKLAENFGNGIANILLNQGLFLEPTFGITLPGDDIPEWFKYQTRNGFFYFQMPEHVFDELAGFALCTIIIQPFTCDFEVTVNGELVMRCTKNFELLISAHLWLLYLPRPVVKPGNGWYDVEISLCDSLDLTVAIERYIRRSGLFLEFKKEGKSNWVLENNTVSPIHYPEVIYDEDSDESEGSSDGMDCDSDEVAEMEDDDSGYSSGPDIRISDKIWVREKKSFDWKSDDVV